MEAKEQEICKDLQQVSEEAQTIESRQDTAQAALRARQKEKQKIQVIICDTTYSWIIWWGNIIDM